jgi:hypothetical protein
MRNAYASDVLAQFLPLSNKFAKLQTHKNYHGDRYIKHFYY